MLFTLLPDVPLAIKCVLNNASLTHWYGQMDFDLETSSKVTVQTNMSAREHTDEALITSEGIFSKTLIIPFPFRKLLRHKFYPKCNK